MWGSVGKQNCRCVCAWVWNRTRSRLVKLAPTSDSGDALVSRQAIGVSKRQAVSYIYYLLPTSAPHQWSELRVRLTDWLNHLAKRRGVAAGEEQETQRNEDISKCEINGKTLRVRNRKLTSNKPVDRSDIRFSNRYLNGAPGRQTDVHSYLSICPLPCITQQCGVPDWNKQNFNSMGLVSHQRVTHYITPKPSSQKWAPLTPPTQPRSIAHRKNSTCRVAVS